MIRGKWSSSLPESPRQETKSALSAMSKNSSTKTSTKTFTRFIRKWDCKGHSSKCGNSRTTSKKTTLWKLFWRPSGLLWLKIPWENHSNWSVSSSRPRFSFTAHQAPTLPASSALWVNSFWILIIEHLLDLKPWSTKSGSSSNTTSPKSSPCWARETKPQVSFSPPISDTLKSKLTNHKITTRTTLHISSCSLIASPNWSTWTDTCSNSHPTTWPI